MATKQVTLPDIGTVTLYKRRGNRSIRLSIAATGEVRVSIPHWLPYKAGADFATSRAPWIIANRPKTHGKALEHAHAIGKAHRLHFVPSNAIDKVLVRTAHNEIRITHPSWMDENDSEVQAAAQRGSLKALRQEAEALLPQRIASLADKTGFAYKSVGVKQLKSRWGSCNSHQEIVLNIFLMQLPWYLIDYVLVHELVHTKVMQHGEPFWREFEKHLPNAKGLRKEISRYQPVLSPRPLTVA